MDRFRSRNYPTGYRRRFRQETIRRVLAMVRGGHGQARVNEVSVRWRRLAKAAADMPHARPGGQRMSGQSAPRGPSHCQPDMCPISVSPSTTDSHFSD